MTLRLGEYAVELVKAKLQANMASRIAVINTDPTLPVLDQPLAVPESYYTSGIQSIPATPAIIIAEGRTDFSEAGPHTLKLSIEIVVVILEADPDRQTLGKRLQRQRRAVIESLYDASPAEKLDEIAYRIMPTRSEPGKTFDQDQDDSYRSTFLLAFNVEQIEE